MVIPHPARRIIWVALLLLAVFGVGVLVAGGSPSPEEGISLWVVRDTARVPQGVTEGAQVARQSLSLALARAGELERPPLYYLLLDAWTLVMGSSLFAVRLPSAFIALLALAFTYHAARRYIHQPGLWALCLLATSPFFISASREAEPQAWLWMLVLLPASALLLSFLMGEFLRQTRFSSSVYSVVVLVGLLIVGQWLAAPLILPVRPNWEAPLAAIQHNRQPLEPALTLIDPHSPLAYYLPHIQRGITLDLGWRARTPAEVRAYLDLMPQAESFWVIMSERLIPEVPESDYEILQQEIIDGMVFARWRLAAER